MGSDRTGQRMQPGMKGWEEYKAQFEEDLEAEAAEQAAANPDFEKVGKDGLTAAERAKKQAERRAAQRRQKAQKNKKQNQGRK